MQPQKGSQMRKPRAKLLRRNQANMCLPIRMVFLFEWGFVAPAHTHTHTRPFVVRPSLWAGLRRLLRPGLRRP